LPACCSSWRGGASTAGVRPGQRQEVVEDVERADLQVAADRLGGGGAGALLGEHAVGRAVGGLQAPLPEAEAEHQRLEEAHRVTDPDRRRRGQVRRGGDAHPRGAGVVEDDPPQHVLGGDRLCRRAGAGQLGRLHQQPSFGQRQLPEAGQVEHLAHGQGVHRPHEHALEPLARGVVSRQVERGRLRQVGRGPVGADLDAVARADLGLSGELLRPAGHGDRVAEVDGHGAEDEDAVGGERVPVPVGVLHEEAGQAGRVTDDDAPDDDRCSGQRRGRPRALHRADLVGHRQRARPGGRRLGRGGAARVDAPGVAAAGPAHTSASLAAS
jgi:hypothetical protein